MKLDEFEHKGIRWTAVVQPVVSPGVESGLEVVFVPDDGREKYAWPMGTRLLEAVVEGGVSLDHHRLRKMLRRAIDGGRRPTGGGDDGEEDMLSQVMLSQIRKLLE